MRIFSLFVTLFLSLATLALAAEKLPAELQDVGIFPNLGQQVTLQTEFQDESGKTVKLADYFDGKQPVALLLNYYGCPMLCGVMLNQAKTAFQSLDWQMGQQYKVVTISIDPTETSAIAAEKKKSILDSIKEEPFRKAAAANWHFLVGQKVNIDRVAGEIGFKYKYIPEEKQYAHGAALFLLSPNGKLDRVLPALSISATDLKLALLEAGEGKVGTIAEKVFSLCYHYDPKASKYTIIATNMMKLGGALTLVVLAFAYFVQFFRRKERIEA